MSDVWDDVRRDFPALGGRVRLVHMNAAACSPTPRPVREAVDGWYRQLEDSADLRWTNWVDRREEVRARVAAFIGASPAEIAFMPNTSAGLNVLADLLGGDGPVLTDELEFPSVTLPWIHRGIPVHFVPAAEGVVWLESFEKPNAPRAATIALSHVQFSNGCRLDLAEFGRIKEDRHLVVSASQSAGAFPIDVHAMGVDGLATTGQKWLCAGFGAGFLYVRKELLEAKPPRSIGWMSVEDPFQFDNRSYTLVKSAARHELGTPAFAGILALGAAVDYWAAIGKELVVARILELNRYLCSELERIGLPVLSPGGHNRSGQTLVGLPDPPRATAFLAGRGIQVTTKPEGVRVSTHCYNTEADVDTLIQALAEYPPTA